MAYHLIFNALTTNIIILYVSSPMQQRSLRPNWSQARCFAWIILFGVPHLFDALRPSPMLFAWKHTIALLFRHKINNPPYQLSSGSLQHLDKRDAPFFMFKYVDKGGKWGKSPDFLQVLTEHEFVYGHRESRELSKWYHQKNQ